MGGDLRERGWGRGGYGRRDTERRGAGRRREPLSPPGLPFPNGECRAVGAHGTARLPGNLSNPSASVQSAPDAVRPQGGPRLPRAPPPRSVDGVCVCDCVHECTSVCDCVYDCVYVVDRGVECHEERDLCTPTRESLALLWLVTTLHFPQRLLLDVPRRLQPPLPLHGVRRLVQEPKLGMGQGAPSSVASAGLTTCTAIAQPREPMIGDLLRKLWGQANGGAGGIHFPFLQPTLTASVGSPALPTCPPKFCQVLFPPQQCQTKGKRQWDQTRSLGWGLSKTHRCFCR